MTTAQAFIPPHCSTGKKRDEDLKIAKFKNYVARKSAVYYILKM